jgi:hypothetical protein
MDVWGRYAPDMTQNGHKLVRFCDVHGCSWMFTDVWGRYAPDMTQNGHKLVRFVMFMDVWGRYAPDMTQNGHKLVRFCDVHGCLGSLRSRYDREMV